MRAKFINEQKQVPEQVINLMLDISSKIKKYLNLKLEPIQDIKYNELTTSYEGIIPNVDDLTTGQLNYLIDLIYDEYPEYKDNIMISYSKDIRGIIVNINTEFIYE